MFHFYTPQKTSGGIDVEHRLKVKDIFLIICYCL